MTINQIQKMFGLSTSAIYNYLAAGGENPHRPGGTQRLHDAEIAALHKQGLLAKSIAEKLNIKLGTVYENLKYIGKKRRHKSKNRL